MIKAILFDMDGTLTDSERYYTEGTFKWTNRYKKISMEDIYKIIGLNMDNTYKTLVKLTGLSYDEVVKLNNDYFEKEDKINYKKYLFNDTDDVLKILKDNNYKLALCSLSEGYMVNNFIKDCSYENMFDLVLCNDEVKKCKPDPEIYLKALDLLHIKNDEALVIEDSYNGILAGKNANIKVFARNMEKYHVDQSLADYIFDDMHEILDKIKLL